MNLIGIRRGWMYLVDVIDWEFRMIVGNPFTNTLNSGFIIECIRKYFLNCPAQAFWGVVVVTVGKG